MPRKYIPEQGDIVLLQFNPQAGHEQSGRRPALVVSPKQYNKRVGLALFCPITSKIKGYPFEVTFPEDFKISGAILSDQIKNLDWRVRDAKRLARAPKNILDETLAKIFALLQGDK
jgi:mRNA interferase MazF